MKRLPGLPPAHSPWIVVEQLMASEQRLTTLFVSSLSPSAAFSVPSPHEVGLH